MRVHAPVSTRPGARAAAPAVVQEALRAPGRPLAEADRAFFEARLGRGYGDVRLHADARADASARAVGAEAYTVGRDIVFAAGRLAPHTAAGRHLLAHELAHVAQPGGDAVLRRKLSFKDCKTSVKGQEDAQEQVLRLAAGDAKALAKSALDRLTQGILAADAEAFAAFQAHFGEPTDDRVKAVSKVFKAIAGSLDNKRFICVGQCRKTQETITCALAAAGNDDIQICPSFFVDPCAKIQPAALVHEAAHNAGAGGDHDKPQPRAKGKKVVYPPPNAESNAYSYHHFAEDLRDGTFQRKATGGAQPREVEVQPDR